MKRLAVLLLFLAGCGSQQPTSSDSVPSTPAQALAIESGHRFAHLRGVRLDSVIITQPPTPKYASWAVCDQYVIGFNVDYIEREDVYGEIPFMAAHEVCHIYLKHNLPCSISMGSHQHELDANACAKELLGS